MFSIFNTIKDSLWGQSDPTGLANQYVSIQGVFYRQVQGDFQVLYRDAEATVRDTQFAFADQLVVYKADGADDYNDFEEVILLSDSIGFSRDHSSFYWRGTGGSVHKFEFGEMSPLVQLFMMKSCQAIYENKFKQDGSNVAESVLEKLCPLLAPNNWTNEKKSDFVQPTSNWANQNKPFTEPTETKKAPKRLVIQSDETSPHHKQSRTRVEEPTPTEYSFKPPNERVVSDEPVTPTFSFKRQNFDVTNEPTREVSPPDYKPQSEYTPTKFTVPEYPPPSDVDDYPDYSSSTRYTSPTTVDYPPYSPSARYTSDTSTTDVAIDSRYEKPISTIQLVDSSSIEEETEIFMIGEEVISVEGDLLKLDLSAGEFSIVKNNIVLQLNDVSEYNERKEFDYMIYVFEDETERVIMKTNITSSMNPQFIESNDGCAFLWRSGDSKQMDIFSLKINIIEDFLLFKEKFIDSLWESNSQKSIDTLDKGDKDWILGAYGQGGDDYHYEEDDGFIEEDMYDFSSDSEYSESFSEHDDEEPINNGQEFLRDKNSILNVGRKSDRSFVIRGEKIGIFKTLTDDIEYQTSISSISTPSKYNFSPKKSMLHEEDTSILLLDDARRNKNKVFKMDLERGEIVEEWDTGSMQVDNLVPETKVAQRTPVKSVMGINKGGFFMLDPRLPGSKIVNRQAFQYKDARRTQFDCAVTTRDGDLAVGSKTGEIRMFSRNSLYSKQDPMGLFKAPRSKTNLPGLGDPIIGIDVTFDGKWILATCKSYLLVIPTSMEDGSSGFHRPMGKEKPVPRLLKLKEEHLSIVGKVSFTQAKFNYGYGTETTIATSTGPFVITWNFRKIKQNNLAQYQIKKYGEVIVADDFSFDNDKTVVVTMPNNVRVASRKLN
eukprot:TRINITY_DN2606_c0_g1_i1.p1 TRINITY_DN2606_c0_g1~~TRINITY_DN2606_c0_g1_i1.p1  ORF type:complete len:884 (-),score=215.21 TRINITY_DN2606_c0_g1_i1:21-2672(-)